MSHADIKHLDEKIAGLNSKVMYLDGKADHLKYEIRRVETTLKSDIHRLRTTLQSDIQRMETHLALQFQFQLLHDMMESRFTLGNWMLGFILALLSGIAVKLFMM